MALLIRIPAILLLAGSAGLVTLCGATVIAAPAPIASAEVESSLDGEPVIMNLAVGSLPRNRVSITGFALDDESLEGCVAYFRGKGVNKMAIILADGTFGTTFQRPTNREFVIEVTVVDVDGNVSEPVQVMFPGL